MNIAFARTTSRNDVLWLFLFIISSISFFYHSLSPLQSTHSQLAGTLLIALGLVIAAVKVWQCGGLRYDFRPAPSTLFVIIIAVIIYTQQVDMRPLWNSEALIIQDAKAVLAGTLLHPLGTSGDFPSNFMNWMVAPIMFVTGNPLYAVRFPAVLLGIFTVVTIGSIGMILLRQSSARCFFLILPLLSIWQIHLCNVGDNNWIAAMPAFVSAQLYLFLRVFQAQSMRSLLLLAFVCGLSFWTLYVPAVSAAIVCLIIVCLPPETLPWQGKRAFLLCLSVFIAPLAGRIIYTDGALIARHLAFASGGEWRENKFESILDALARYYESVASILRSSLPSLGHIHGDLRGVVLEPSTFAYLLVGFVSTMLCLSRKIFSLIYLHFTLLFLGIIASNPIPSVHRVIAIAPYLFIFAALGAESLTNIMALRFGEKVKSCLRFSLCLVHLTVFGIYYGEYSAVQFRPERIQSYARILFEALNREPQSSRGAILVPEGQHKLFSAYHYPNRAVLSYGTCQQLSKAVENNEVLMVATEVQDNSAHALEYECITKLLDSLGARYFALTAPDQSVAGRLYLLGNYWQER